MRLRIKRDMFTGEQHLNAGEHVVSNLLTPPRDAEVWDGEKFVAVPLNANKSVDREALDALLIGVEDEPEKEDEDVWPDLSTGRKPRSRKR